MNRVYFLVILLCFCTGLDLEAQDRKNGKCRIINPDSTISTGKKKRGQKEGEWITTDRSGSVILKQNYSKGRKNGVSLTLSPADDTLEYAHYRQDSLHGPWLTKMPYNSIVVRGEFRSHKMVGWWVTYYVNSTEGAHLDSIFYSDGNKEGLARYYLNGILYKDVPYSNGQINGTVRKYHSRGDLGETSEFKNDTLNGFVIGYSAGRKTSEKYYVMGKLRFAKSYFVDSDSLNSLSLFDARGNISYHQNYGSPGIVSARMWFDSRSRLDSSFLYDSTGKITHRTYFRQDAILNGDTTFEARHYLYHSNGKLDHNEFYFGYVRVGTWQYFSEDGHKIKELQFIDGENYMIYRTFYDNGQVQLYAPLCNAMYYDTLLIFRKNGTAVKAGTKEYLGIFRIVDSLETKYEFIYSMTLYTPRLHPLDPDTGDFRCHPPLGNIYTSVDVQPTFRGDSLNVFLKSNLRYPQMEKETGKEGIVYVRFVVETDGSISNVALAKGVAGAPGLNKEALRVISSMPKWNPGLKYGNPVRTEMTIPVRFSLR